MLIEAAHRRVPKQTRIRTHKAAGRAYGDRPRSSRPPRLLHRRAAPGRPDLRQSTGNTRHRPHPHAPGSHTSARNARISSSGSTAPIAVVPKVTTTVPTSPLRSSSSRASSRMRPRSSAATPLYSQLEHGRNPPVRVVGLRGTDNSLPRRQLPCHPKRLQVGHRPARSQVAQRFCPAKHARDSRNRLDLHLRAGSSAVAGVVVRVDRHRQRIGGARHRVRRLQHLPRIEGMEIGVVVAQPVGRLFREPLHGRGVRVGFGRRAQTAGRCGKFRSPAARCAGQEFGESDRGS